jgi:fructose-bisphosphate aldolase class II
VSDDGLARAVARGIVKVNVGTQLNKAFTAAVRDYLAANLDVVDPRKYLEPGRAAIAAEVARLLGVLHG